MRAPTRYGRSIWRAEVVAPYEVAAVNGTRASGVASIPLTLTRQMGGSRKASLTLARAARPEGGEGDSQEEGEPSGSLSSCAQCGRAGRIPAREARAPPSALLGRISRAARVHFHPLEK